MPLPPLCWNSVLGLSKHGFLVHSPTFTHWGGGGGGLCVHLVPMCSLVTPGGCAVCICSAHSAPMVHQTSLIKGKCKDELFIVKNFKVTTAALTKASWAQVQTRALREATVWASGTLYVGGGMGSGQEFPAHRQLSVVHLKQTTVGTACLGGRLWGCPVPVRRQWWEGRSCFFSIPDLTCTHQEQLSAKIAPS